MSVSPCRSYSSWQNLPIWVPACAARRRQLRRAQRHFLWVVFFLDAVSAAPLPQMFAKKLLAVRIEDAHAQPVPLHPADTPDAPGGAP